jgi:hypothetical protein
MNISIRLSRNETRAEDMPDYDNAAPFARSTMIQPCYVKILCAVKRPIGMNRSS